MARRVLVTVGALLLAAIFFSIPLVLKYRVYRPSEQTVAAGDVVPVRLSGVSTLWCQAVQIESPYSFEAYEFDGEEPKVQEDEVVRSVSPLKVHLERGEQEWWGFHLLRGSRAQLSGCSQLPRAGVTVVQGGDALEQCLRQHRARNNGDDDSEEDSLSDSESDEGTSSISSSQGVIGNDSTALLECGSALQHAPLSVSYACTHAPVLSSALSLEANVTGYYYFVFASNMYLDIVPNDLTLEFTIDRTQYDWSDCTSNCSRGHECRLPVPMRGRHGPVVLATEVGNGTLLKTHTVLVSCRPRESLFLLFYAFAFLTIFLCAFQ